jgi:hypothetical protein
LRVTQAFVAALRASDLSQNDVAKCCRFQIPELSRFIKGEVPDTRHNRARFKHAAMLIGYDGPLFEEGR